ncbi:hypothetical protein LCM08_06190 [Salipiger pacificus]|nr:hypothetical protein [Alloyangia pacifica]
MSSKAVRDAVKGWFAANWAETPWFDLTDYISREELPPSLPNGEWVGVQFVGGSETLASIGPENIYREDGAIMLHVIVPAGFSSDPAIDLCERLRLALRGRTLGDVYIEAIDPPTDANGAAIQIDGPWNGYTMAADYTVN